MGVNIAQIRKILGEIVGHPPITHESAKPKAAQTAAESTFAPSTRDTRVQVFGTFNGVRGVEADLLTTAESNAKRAIDPAKPFKLDTKAEFYGKGEKIG